MQALTRRDGVVVERDFVVPRGARVELDAPVGIYATRDIIIEGALVSRGGAVAVLTAARDVRISGRVETSAALAPAATRTARAASHRASASGRVAPADSPAPREAAAAPAAT